MNNADLTFGAGSRVCLGRHLGLAEVYQAVTTFLVRHETEMVDLEREWWVRNGVFSSAKGPRVKARVRW